MIKFFRKIRQRLLSENKFSKYLIYAIGEIILVVIGILIALQVNNWNERRQNQKKEILYLTRLTTNLGYDKRLYETIMINDSILINKLYDVEKNLSKFIKNVDNPIEDLDVLIAAYKFTSNRTTIDNLISSGKIELLRSNYLVEDIFLYYRTTEDIDRAVDQAIIKYNREKFSDLIIEFDKNNILDNNYRLRLANSINFKINIIQTQLNLYSKQKSFAEKLINKINDEIEFIRKN
ncbi:MAG: hypothetical protein BM564_01185 [Bacteroidetes bacterium MedPE-SWsnd-G2]|nr:MAG: hypothetical protein BM564_01185 [Bacteroidetes bacterium MedPE-SWsnd-G2]